MYDYCSDKLDEWLYTGILANDESLPYTAEMYTRQSLTEERIIDK